MIVFKRPLADRLSLLLHRGDEKKKERKERINVARNAVSQRLANGVKMIGDITDDNGYIAIRRHLTKGALQLIEQEQNPMKYNERRVTEELDKYLHAPEFRLKTLALELDRLSKKWHLPV